MHNMNGKRQQWSVEENLSPCPVVLVDYSLEKKGLLLIHENFFFLNTLQCIHV